MKKHITLDKKYKGPDHHFALEPSDYLILLTLRKSEQALGSFTKDIDISEIQNRKIGNRSIHVIKDLFPGDKIKRSDLVFKKT